MNESNSNELASQPHETIFIFRLGCTLGDPRVLECAPVAACEDASDKTWPLHSLAHSAIAAACCTR